jgi:hypothetical protein
MPLHDGRWLHEDQRLLPLLQHPSEHGPDHPVAVFDLGARHESLQDRELVTERGILQNELGTVLDGQVQDADERCEAGHVEMVAPGPLDLQTEPR